MEEVRVPRETGKDLANGEVSPPGCVWTKVRGRPPMRRRWTRLWTVEVKRPLLGVVMVKEGPLEWPEAVLLAPRVAPKRPGTGNA